MMALAFRAPYDNYERHFAITQHAVERLRERLTEESRTEHRDDRDLGNYLDSCIHAALGAGREEAFEETRAGGHPPHTIIIRYGAQRRQSRYTCPYVLLGTRVLRCTGGARRAGADPSHPAGEEANRPFSVTDVPGEDSV